MEDFGIMKIDPSERFAQLPHALANHPIIAEDHELWGKWVRLHLAADMAYPADAQIPRYVTDEELGRLAEYELIARTGEDFYRSVIVDQTASARREQAARQPRGSDGRFARIPRRDTGEADMWWRGERSIDPDDIPF
jgi:hypothetical protein